MKNRRRFELLMGAATVVVAFMIPLAIGEVVLRSMAPEPNRPGLFDQTPSAHETLGRPSATGVYTGAKVQFNSHGLRDREFSVERAPGTYRVIVLGDSITFGEGVDQDQAYPRQLDRMLRDSPPPGYRSVEVLNFAMPGYNTRQELSLLREIGVRFKPDLVVVGFFYNDITPTPRQLAEDAKRAGGAAPAGQSGGALSAINDAIRAVKRSSLMLAWISPRVGLVARRLGWKGLGEAGAFKTQFQEDSHFWGQSRQALLEMKRLGEQEGFRLALLILPLTVNLTEATYPLAEYHQAVAAFCKKEGIPHLDLLGPLWGQDLSRTWIYPTDGHPNAQGHRTFADAAAPFLRETIAAHAPPK
jgi:lysophospholipase L1-like esterase